MCIAIHCGLLSQAFRFILEVSGKTLVSSGPCFLRQRHHKVYEIHENFALVPEEVLDMRALSMPDPPARDEMGDDDLLDEIEGMLPEPKVSRKRRRVVLDRSA